MKKLIALVLALVLTLGTTAALAAGYGLGVSTSISSSKDATAEKKLLDKQNDMIRKELKNATKALERPIYKIAKKIAPLFLKY